MQQMIKYLVSVLLLSTATASDCTSKDCTAGADETSLIQVKQQVKRRAESSSEAALVEKHVRAGLKLSQKIAKAAQTLEEGSFKSLFQMFAICGQCHSFQRWGEMNDGGYLMCMDNLKRGFVRAAYSLGVEQHDQWSEDASTKLGVPVDQFDCTVTEPAKRCSTCRFHQKCIVAADGQSPVPLHEDEGWSLMQALSETGQANAPDGSLLMKMDIEGSEWPLYASDSPDELKKFGQIIMEFHGLQDVSRHPLYLKAMEHILASGLNVVHLHGNNHEASFVVGDTTFPRVLEVTFARGKRRADGCLKDQDYVFMMDSPNWGARGELPMIHIGNHDATVPDEEVVRENGEVPEFQPQAHLQEIEPEWMAPMGEEALEDAESEDDAPGAADNLLDLGAEDLKQIDPELFGDIFGDDMQEVVHEDLARTTSDEQQTDPQIDTPILPSKDDDMLPLDQHVTLDYEPLDEHQDQEVTLENWEKNEPQEADFLNTALFNKDDEAQLQRLEDELFTQEQANDVKLFRQRAEKEMM